MGLMKELNDLNNIYQDMYTEDENKGYVVTAADKKGNTPAWQGYKAGKKKKDGKPMYRPADHLKDEVEILKGLIESGKLSEDEVKDILWNQIEEDAQSDAIAQMSGAGGDPQDDAMKQLVDAEKKAEKKAAKKKKVKSEGYQRNPEKGEAEERKRSKKVRGERTPMPPRGDKRREDFERWYAANVR